MIEEEFQDLLYILPLIFAECPDLVQGEGVKADNPGGFHSHEGFLGEILELLPLGQGNTMMGIGDNDGLFAVLLLPLKLQGLIQFAIIRRYLEVRPDDLHAKAHMAPRDLNDSVDTRILGRLGHLKAQVPQD